MPQGRRQHSTLRGISLVSARSTERCPHDDSRKRGMPVTAKKTFVLRSGGLLVFGLLVLFAFGCTGHTSKTARAREADKQPASASNPMGRQLDGGSYCVQSLAQGPPLSRPIHFSNKETQSDGSSKDFESDLAGDKLDVTIHERHPATDFDKEVNTMKGMTPVPIRDGFAESVRTNHFVRSDNSGWTMGANSVVLGATPWQLFINKPIVTEVGTDNISGYATLKYAVDTTHQSEMDKAALLAAGRLKDYNIVGDAWVMKEKNCILQYSIDFEQDEPSGKISKTHYEGGISQQ
jgi:hypothetical protein